MNPITFQDRMRSLFGGILSAIGAFIWRRGIHPDTLTILGLIVVAVASFLISQGQFQLAGVVLLVGLPLDALDGAVARAMQRKGEFGGVLDSALDRYADSFLFGGLLFYYAVQDQYLLMLMCLAALMGSYGTSYLRARAGQAGITIKIGLIDRLVRVIILLVGLLLPQFLQIAIIVLAIGCNVTAAQRLRYAKQHMPDQ